MNVALTLLIFTLVVSLLFSGVLIFVYLQVTRKRRELIALLGGSGRAVPRFKHALMSIYVISTCLWTIGFFVYFFQIS